MSRPNIDSRPTRDITGVVSDMLGKPPEVSSEKMSEVEEVKPQEVLREKAPEVQSVKPLAVLTVKSKKGKTENPPVVAPIEREKTSFAIPPSVKRHLTMLKLDLRSGGHRITEAEIVETLIATASVANVLEALRRRPLP
jgi:hypothetical protein